MSGKAQDYYDILGVSQNASEEEIKKAYIRLLRENHPVYYEGLLIQYKNSGDKKLIKMVKEKLEEATEISKRINEAYEILSDPKKRDSYNASLAAITISKTEINLGLIKQGEIVVSSTEIKHIQGLVDSVHIDWDQKPSWGEIIINPDPENTFPITIKIVVDTTRLSPSIYEQQILITINNESYTVSVSFEVDSTAAKRKEPPSRSDTPSRSVGIPSLILRFLIYDATSFLVYSMTSWRKIISCIFLMGMAACILSAGTAFGARKLLRLLREVNSVERSVAEMRQEDVSIPSSQNSTMNTPYSDQGVQIIEKKFDVRAEGGWQNTGIELKPGDKVEIEYISGRWTIDAQYLSSAGPEGYAELNDSNRQYLPLPEANPGALIGRIGKNYPLKVGTGIFFQVTKPGELYLGINNNLVENNEGYITVSIRVTKTHP